MSKVIKGTVLLVIGLSLATAYHVTNRLALAEGCRQGIWSYLKYTIGELADKDQEPIVNGQIIKFCEKSLK